MFIPDPLLVGKRVLVVEDELLCGDADRESRWKNANAASSVRAAPLRKRLRRPEPRRSTWLCWTSTCGARRFTRWRSCFQSGISRSCSCPAMATTRSCLVGDAWKVCAKPFKGNDLVKMMSEALLAETH